MTEESTEDMDKDDVALMIYTSGTTGRPKGVMLTHNNLYSNALQGREANDWDEPAISILCLPLAHSFGVVAMNAGNLSRSRESFEVLMSWFNPEEIFRLIGQYRATQFFGVPTMYQVLVNHPAADKYDTSSLERCVISGGPVTEELYGAFTSKFNCEMQEGYGLTEASPAVAMCRRSMPQKKGSCGVPLPGVEVKIFDGEDKELPPCEQGEIVVRGPNVMKGYYKRPEETETVLRGGWLHTGDVGYLDEEGYLYVTDRIKDMIIKGGYNIYPSEIEGYLEEHPAIREVAVIGLPDEKYGEEIMAFVVSEPGHVSSEEEVIAYAQSRITRFKCPSRVTFLESLPKNPVGKVQKKELKKRV
jgi:long-chain acyl-CoA synthetase